MDRIYQHIPLHFLAVCGRVRPSTTGFEALGTVVGRAADVGDGVRVAAISVGVATVADLTALEGRGGVALSGLILRSPQHQEITTKSER